MTTSDSFPDEITVSMRVDDMPTAPVLDSLIQPCEWCGSDVWISPGTQLSIDRGEYPDRISCVQCVTDSEDGED